MKITEVSPDEYKALSPEVPHAFGSVEFSELNRGKALSLHYLLFADTKVRFGLILGEKEDGCYSPFSAPFGGFAMRGGNQRLLEMEEAVILLQEFRQSCGKPLHITLPPLIYDVSQLSKWANVFQRFGKMSGMDLNYHFDLSLFPRYEEVIKRSAKEKLHNFEKAGFEFTRLDGNSDSDIERAYAVISANRKEHGYPLRMTMQAVKDTVKIISADFFVMTYEGKDVAAAQVFHVAKGIAQVVYWGDLRAYSQLRTMNGLACNIFSYYHSRGLKLLDIGPATVDGVPNHGLCEFKESIGCSVTPKFTFVI